VVSNQAASPSHRLRFLRRLAGAATLLGAVCVAAALASPVVHAAPSPSASVSPTPTATATPTPTPSDTSSGSHGLVGEALDGVASWIIDGATQGATDLLGALGNEVTSPDLSAPWFNSIYWGGNGTPTAPGQPGSTAPGAVVIAAWLTLIVVLASLLVGVIRGDVGGMVRLVALRLPVAILITCIATWLVTQLMTLTDIASGWVLSGGTQSLQQWTAQLQTGDTGHDFLSVIASLVLLAATLLGYLELLARDAAIYIVAAFVPLIAVASLWSGAHNALKRGAETMFVLVISKFVLVFVLVLGAGALTASTNMQGFASLLTGTLIFLLAALAPFAVFRLIPFLEMSVVAGMAGGASRVGARWGMQAAGAAHGAVGSGLGHAQQASDWFGKRLDQGIAGQPQGGGGGSATPSSAAPLRFAGGSSPGAGPAPGGSPPTPGPASPGPGPAPAAGPVNPALPVQGPAVAGGASSAGAAPAVAVPVP
jgi:hypothetical protein